MNKLVSITLCFIFSALNITAQQWQWAKSGGSPGPAFNNVEETARYMTTDKWGNIYLIGNAYQSGMNVDGQSLNGFGYDDIVLTSFTCSGTYRWSKVIGTSMPDFANAVVHADSLGGVYLSCMLSVTGTTAYFDSDTTVANSYKSFYLIKYDSAGTYQWLRMPQADTVTSSSYFTYAIDIDGDGSGNVDLFCQLQPGAYGNGAFVANDTGTYVLRYNAQGNLTGGTQVPILVTEYAQSCIKMKRDYNSGRYYFAGSAGVSVPGTVAINGVPFNNSQYVVAVNSQGQFLWLKNDNGTLNSFNGRPALDDSGNVYVTGYGRTGDAFNGYTYNTTYTSGPMVASLDSNGTNRWVQYALTNASTRGYGIIHRNAHEVVMVGGYSGKVEWPGYSGPHPMHGINQNYDVFITSFNTHTGMVNDVDTLGGIFGGFDEATWVAADGNGNIYVAGRYGGSLYVGTADTLQLTGGQSDFFVAKHGYPGCAPQSVNELVISSDIVVYPNPVTELLQIQGLTAQTSYRLLSITGVVVQVGILQPDSKGISTDRLAPAMYILELQNKEQWAAMRIMKQ